MDWIGAGVVLCLTGALAGILLWVSWSQRQYAGFWWSAAGMAIALDGSITLAGGPAVLLPFAKDAIGPTAAWLFYRGACVYADRPPRRIAAVLALAATAAWFFVHLRGYEEWTFRATVTAELPLVAAAGWLVYRAADSTMTRLFAASLAFPTVLVLLNPTLKAAGISPDTSAMLWMAGTCPLVLYAIAVFLERGLREKNRVLEAQGVLLRRYRSDLEQLVADRTEQLELSQQRLRQSERLASIGTLTAGLAHQVNNPVGSIMAAAGFARQCRGDDDEIETLRDAIGDIEHEAARCGEIVRDMLRFASDRPSDKKVIPVGDILDRVVSATSRLAREHEAIVELDRTGASQLVFASTLELEQALSNIVENAILSREHGARVRVSTRRVAGDQVSIDVRDDGCGISAEDQGHVLDPFFTSRLDSGGTGLGLSVAHGIAQEHAGELRIDSAPGRGTTVSLTLPIAS